MREVVSLSVGSVDREGMTPEAFRLLENIARYNNVIEEEAYAAMLQRMEELKRRKAAMAERNKVLFARAMTRATEVIHDIDMAGYASVMESIMNTPWYTKYPAVFTGFVTAEYLLFTGHPKGDVWVPRAEVEGVPDVGDEAGIVAWEDEYGDVVGTLTDAHTDALDIKDALRSGESVEVTYIGRHRGVTYGVAGDVLVIDHTNKLRRTGVTHVKGGTVIMRPGEVCWVLR